MKGEIGTVYDGFADGQISLPSRRGMQKGTIIDALP